MKHLSCLFHMLETFYEEYVLDIQNYMKNNRENSKYF